MKKQTHASVAERLYVCEQWTFEAIAAELNIAERTIRTWAQQGAWQEKRAAYLKERTTLEQDLVGFARKLVKLISLDIERLEQSGTDNPEHDRRIESRINAISRLLARLPQTRAYEKAVQQEEQAAAKDGQQASGDEIVAKVNAILGAE